MQLRRTAVAIVTLLLVAVPSACSDSAKEAQCIRSGDAKVCVVRDNAAAWSFEVDGLKPGSTVELTSVAAGAKEYLLDDRGRLPGKVGFVGSPDSAMTVAVMATAADGAALSGTLDVGR